MTSVSFGVLGPVTAHGPAGEIPIRGARPRAVLARLLVAHGRVVPVDQLVDDLWERPPDGAVGALRTFVGDLRRSLEPDRPPRRASALLVTEPPGYALRAAAADVDALVFESAVTAARDLPAAEALRRLDAVVALWRGPAYSEFADRSWARAEIDRLGELRLLAVERRATALLELGRAAEAATDLRGHVTGNPLREDGWRLLALALYRASRQADALAALREARELLGSELGLDPGPALRQLETGILTQSPHLDPPVSAALPGPVSGARPFVGRDGELRRIGEVAEQVTRERRPRLVLLSGDPGGGKSALAGAVSGRMRAGGWTVAWGAGPEHDGAPVAWAWDQVAAGLGVELAGGDRFQRYRAVRGLIVGRTPLLVVLDDLQRMDAGALDVLSALLTGPEMISGAVLFLGTYRSVDISAELTAVLARLAPAEPLRIRLGGLPEPVTARLVALVTGSEPDAATNRVLHRRSGGNPFFVRELARVLAGEGRAALDAVPAGVRDVIRHRLDRLPDQHRIVLRQAAVLGREIRPDELAGLAGPSGSPAGDSTVLDALDDGLRAGFLAEEGDRLRFVHILVRDTLYAEVSAPRRSRWHARAGEVIERLRPTAVTELAHHFDRAGTRDTAARAAAYARAAAEQAEARSNPHEAARLWQQCRAGTARTDPTVIMGLARALAVTGRLNEARALRTEAIDAVAGGSPDPAVVAAVLTAFTVPAIWPANDDEELSGRIVHMAERALAGLPPDDPVLRSRLLSTLALELRGTTGGRGDTAAREAESLARAADDPAALAFALNARFMHTFQRCGLAADRATIGAELVDLAARHELATFEVLGHLILMQAYCALDRLADADAAARAVDRLAARHDLPVAGAFTAWYAALRLALAGRGTEAGVAYEQADRLLRGHGIAAMEHGLPALARLSLNPLAEGVWGPFEPWVRPLILVARGRSDEASRALHAVPESPRDLLREVRACLVARAAVMVGDREKMRRVYAELRPAEGEIAAGSGLVSFGPVAEHLRALEKALGQAP